MSVAGVTVQITDNDTAGVQICSPADRPMSQLLVGYWTFMDSLELLARSIWSKGDC